MVRRRDREGERRGLSKLGTWTLATVATAVIGTLVSVLVPRALSGRSGKTTATAVRIFNPITLSGVQNPNLKVVSRDRGQCESGSESDPGNPNAFRCFGRRLIYDPCFAAPSRLVCISVPWDSRAAVFVATNGTIDKQRPLDSKMPWALELTNGQRCGLVGGATTTVAGLRLNYVCSATGRAATIAVDAAYGWPNEHSKVWTIPYAPANSEVLSEMGIKVAWY